MTVSRTPVSAERRAPGPPRGLLRRVPPEGDVEHRRLLPSAELSEFIAHFWWVRWNLPRPFVTETLPFPCVHLVFESPGARGEIAGVTSRRFSRRLEGSGRVFGVKFRPGAFHPLAKGPMARLKDCSVPIEHILGRAGATLAQKVAESTRLEDAIATAEPLLGEMLPRMPSEVATLRDLAERIEADRDLIRVEDLARLSGMQVRTVERRFRDYVGASPKWVIRRYRLIEAAERLATGHLTVAKVSADLGYFDQSHFVRDFKALIGRTPSEFAAAERTASAVAIG